MVRMSVLLGLLWLVGSAGCVFGDEPKPRRAKLPSDQELAEYEARSRQMVLDSRTPFANPPEIHSGNGVLRTTLVVTFAHNRIGNDPVLLRSYNGFLVGPTLRVQSNDRLSIRLLNDLPSEPETLSGHDINIPPHGSNTTNLHTHGLHASPEDNGDNPLLEVLPNGSQNYEIRLGTSNPAGMAVATHPPGTHWYHSHKHGAAAIQLASGMAGVLIVEGGLDEVPEIKAARERILVFQQIPYSESVPGVLEGIEGLTRIRDWSRMTHRYTTINGLLNPVIEMAPQEVERWRFVHAGLSARLNLALKPKDAGRENLDLHEIAVDGIALGSIDLQQQIEMTAGGTSDVLIKAPAEPGEYLLVKLADPLARLSPDPMIITGTPEDTLARIVVRGPARPMNLPNANALANLAPYRDIDEVQRYRTLTLGGEGGDVPRWTFDNKQFNPDRTDLTPVLGTAEEWTLKSANQAHPFHIHVNAFQVLSIKDKEGRETLKRPGIWRDTVLIDEGETIRFRTRFEDFQGKTVLHCHKLEHEDQGMMQLIRIVPESAQQGSAAGAVEKAELQPPQKAPAWRLSDAQGTMHELRDFAGKRVVLVFFRGMSCLHCVEQLRMLAGRGKSLREAGVVVVAISSNAWAAGDANPDKDSDFPFLVLADGAQEVFKQYGCYTRGPMHGVFAIDGQGQIRWRNVSETPFSNIDRILEVSAQLDLSSK